MRFLISLALCIFSIQAMAVDPKAADPKTYTATRNRARKAAEVALYAALTDKGDTLKTEIQKKYGEKNVLGWIFTPKVYSRNRTRENLVTSVVGYNLQYNVIKNGEMIPMHSNRTFTVPASIQENDKGGKFTATVLASSLDFNALRQVNSLDLIIDDCGCYYEEYTHYEHWESTTIYESSQGTTIFETLPKQETNNDIWKSSWNPSGRAPRKK